MLSAILNLDKNGHLQKKSHGEAYVIPPEAKQKLLLNIKDLHNTFSSSYDWVIEQEKQLGQLSHQIMEKLQYHQMNENDSGDVDVGCDGQTDMLNDAKPNKKKTSRSRNGIDRSTNGNGSNGTTAASNNSNDNNGSNSGIGSRENHNNLSDSSDDSSDKMRKKIHQSESKPKIKPKMKLPRKTTDLLQNWLLNHLDHPYPSKEEKEKLCNETGLNKKQLLNWFTNTRKRFLEPLRKRNAQNLSNENKILTKKYKEKNERDIKKHAPPIELSNEKQNPEADQDQDSSESSESLDSDDLLEDFSQDFQPDSQNRPSNTQPANPEFIADSSQPQFNEIQPINHYHPQPVIVQAPTHIPQMLPVAQPIYIISSPYPNTFIQPTPMGQPYIIQPTQINNQIPWQTINQPYPVNFANSMPAGDPRMPQPISGATSITPTENAYFQPYQPIVGINYIPRSGPVYIPAPQGMVYQGYDGAPGPYIAYPQNYSTSFNTIQNNVYNNINNFRPMGLLAPNDFQNPQPAEPQALQNVSNMQEEVIIEGQNRLEKRIDLIPDDESVKEPWDSCVGGTAEENPNTQTNEIAYENIDVQEKAKNKLRRPSIDESVYSAGERKILHREEGEKP